MLDYNEEVIYFEKEIGIAHTNKQCVNQQKETVKRRVVECKKDELVPINEDLFTRCECCKN